MMTLTEIRRAIESTSHDERFEGWLALYNGSVDFAATELERIASQNDPLLKVRFCTFLAEIEEEKAVDFLVRFVADTNAIVSSRAIKAFQKNTWPPKPKKLLPLLNTTEGETLTFCIETLSLAVIPEALMPMIALLKNADTELTLAILSGLRIMADPRSLADIIPYLEDSREEVRYSALLALGSLYERKIPNTRKLVLKKTEDQSARVRQSAVWILRRVFNKKNFSLMQGLATNDPEPIVRQEAIMGIAEFGTTKALTAVIKILASEKSSLVILKGESSLLNASPEALIATLEKLINAKNEAVQRTVFGLYANFKRGSDRFFNYLIHQYKKATSERHRVMIIESLGKLCHADAIPFLENLVGTSAIITYTAIAALTKIWTGKPNFPTLKYLKLPHLTDLTHQIVLRHHIKTANDTAIETALRDELVIMLKSQNLNVRYLAAQALIKEGDPTVLKPLFDCFLMEQDTTAAHLIRENVLSLTARSPDILNELFKTHLDNDIAIVTILDLMREVKMPKENLLKIISSWFAEPYNFLERPYQKTVVEFIMSRMQKRDLSFAELFDSPLDDAIKFKLIDEITSKIQRFPLIKLSAPERLIHQWLNADQKKQIAAVKILSHAPENHSISELVGIILTSPDEVITKLATEALSLQINVRGDIAISKIL